MNIRHNSNIPFVLGFSLQEYLSAEQGILAADKANFDYWYIDCSLLGESPGDWNAKRIDNMLLMIATHKVQPIVHGNFKLPLASEITELQKTAIDCAKKEIDLAAQLNNAPVIIHGGAIVEPRLVIKSKKKALEHFIKSIESLSDYAIKKNVNLYLENLSNYKNYWPFHYIFTQIEEFDFVFSRINNVSLFLDIGHANVCDGDPISMIKLFHDRIVGMSFSNNDGIKDQHLQLDKGSIDYKKIISTILECEWKGIIGFETRGRDAQQSVKDLYNLYRMVIPPYKNEMKFNSMKGICHDV